MTHRSSRDRRGRGMRGPAILPERPGEPVLPTPRERFDELVLEVVADLERRWADRLGLVEYGVEDAPQIPDDWATGTVPLSSLVRGSGGQPVGWPDHEGIKGEPRIEFQHYDASARKRLDKLCNTSWLTPLSVSNTPSPLMVAAG